MREYSAEEREAAAEELAGRYGMKFLEIICQAEAGGYMKYAIDLQCDLTRCRELLKDVQFP